MTDKTNTILETDTQKISLFKFLRKFLKGKIKGDGFAINNLLTFFEENSRKDSLLNRLIHLFNKNIPLGFHYFLTLGLIISILNELTDIMVLPLKDEDKQPLQILDREIKGGSGFFDGKTLTERFTGITPDTIEGINGLVALLQSMKPTFESVNDSLNSTILPLIKTIKPENIEKIKTMIPEILDLLNTTILPLIRSIPELKKKLRIFFENLRVKLINLLYNFIKDLPFDKFHQFFLKLNNGDITDIIEKTIKLFRILPEDSKFEENYNIMLFLQKNSEKIKQFIGISEEDSPDEIFKQIMDFVNKLLATKAEGNENEFKKLILNLFTVSEKLNSIYILFTFGLIQSIATYKLKNKEIPQPLKIKKSLKERLSDKIMRRKKQSDNPLDTRNAPFVGGKKTKKKSRRKTKKKSRRKTRKLSRKRTKKR